MQPSIDFVAQGGRTMQGRVTGRMGRTQLRIAYTIANGEQRERWFPRKRYDLESLEGDLDAVPRFKRVRCPGVQLDTPADFGSPEADALRSCDACGGRHELKYGPTRLDPDAPGPKSASGLVTTYSGTFDRLYEVEEEEVQP